MTVPERYERYRHEMWISRPGKQFRVLSPQYGEWSMYVAGCRAQNIMRDRFRKLLKRTGGFRP